MGRDYQFRNNKDGKRCPRTVQKFNLERGLHPTQKPTQLFEYLIKKLLMFLSKSTLASLGK